MRKNLNSEGNLLNAFKVIRDKDIIYTYKTPQMLVFNSNFWGAAPNLLSGVFIVMNINLKLFVYSIINVDLLKLMTYNFSFTSVKTSLIPLS